MATVVLRSVGGLASLRRGPGSTMVWAAGCNGALHKWYVCKQMTSRNMDFISRTKYTMSYIHGHDTTTHAPTHLTKTIGQFLDESAEKYADKVFAVFPETEQRKTYKQFREKADRLAAGLVSLGIERGDRLGIWSPNTMEWVLTQFAAARVGAILVNLNPAYQLPEIKYTLKKVGVKALIAPKVFKTQRYYRILADLCPELKTAKAGKLKSKNLPDLHTVIITGSEKLPGAFLFKDVLDFGRKEHYDVIDERKSTIQFDDIANIQFTSGTTGRPKATCLTHFNILNCISIQAFVHPTIRNQVNCLPAPLFHTMGMSTSLFSMMSGSTLVCPSTGYDARALLQAFQDEKCTRFFGPPTMLIDIMHHPEFATFDLSSWDTVYTGGSPIPVEVVRRLRESVPSIKKFILVYGMTESTGATCLTRTDDPEEVSQSTVGRPVPWSEIKITDPTSGAVVPVGQQGELCVRAPGVMVGYWDDPVRTQEALDESRWLHTGDLGSMDDNGYIRIIGRIKDIVIRGGENISTIQIEELLHTHPKIEDVHVVGVPDEKMIEELCACVKLRSGQTIDAEEVKEFCRRSISHYMVPRYVQFVDAFPKTPTGKVKKFQLKEEMAAKLNLV